MNGDGEEMDRRAPLIRAFGVMSVCGLLLGTVPEILNYYYGTSFQIGFWPFVLIAVSGGWCAVVSSIGFGAIGGALTALIISVSGSLSYVLLQKSSFNEALRLFLSSVIITTVLGSFVGLLGGLPVWLWRAWQQNRRRKVG